jgi:HAD superfamily hydrolase (TIGR01549 family)
MFGPLKNIIFDLDGTLISSMQTAIKGILEAIEAGSAKKIDSALLPLGRTPQMIIRDFVPESEWPKALMYWENFELNIFENIQVFKGVEELLGDLHARGVFLSIYTGRDRLGTSRILEHKKWIPKYFDYDRIRCGDDSTGHKPSPLPIEDLCKKYSLNKKETLMVGDHPVDAHSAKAAGVHFAAALWDLPGNTTQSSRSRYADSWKRWDGIDVQFRLPEPLSLREYFATKL